MTSIIKSQSHPSSIHQIQSNGLVMQRTEARLNFPYPLRKKSATATRRRRTGIASSCRSASANSPGWRWPGDCMQLQWQYFLASRRIILE